MPVETARKNQIRLICERVSLCSGSSDEVDPKGVISYIGRGRVVSRLPAAVPAGVEATESASMIGNGCSLRAKEGLGSNHQHERRPKKPLQLTLDQDWTTVNQRHA